MTMSPSESWGVLPSKLRDQLLKREWLAPANFKARLTGARPFPINISLRPPTGREATENLESYSAFVSAWRAVSDQSPVYWEEVDRRGLNNQMMPIRFIVHTMNDLASFLGPEAVARYERVENILATFRPLGDAVVNGAIGCLLDLEALNSSTVSMLSHVLPQISAGMGRGSYLRSLPLKGVDTKFLEINQTVLFNLVRSTHPHWQGENSLLDFLQVRSKPNDWMVARPLCNETRKLFQGMMSFRVSTESLLAMDPGVTSILVVENEESVFALPETSGVLAIGGCGLNLNWLQAPWLADARIGYWGDIDSWGFHCLAMARSQQGHLESLMMDAEALRSHPSGVTEPRSTDADPSPWLTPEERRAYELLGTPSGMLRYEQERLHQDYIVTRVKAWSAESVSDKTADAEGNSQ